MWHCPNCGAPQAETARCWVCRKSSTTCSTCRHFRASLAPDLGYCALDRQRRPLTGLELRGCWTERRSTAEGQGAPRTAEELTAARRRGVPARGFVPVDEVEQPGPSAAITAPIILLGDPADSWDARTSLFGDPER
jgi:hypothetical protein